MNPADRSITADELKTMFTGKIRVGDEIGLYLDANVDQRMAALLRASRVLVSDVYVEGQAEGKADTRILAKARVMGFVTVTQDRDFRDIHDRIMSIEGLSHAGIILIKSMALKSDAAQLADIVARLTEKYEGSSDVLYSQIFTLCWKGGGLQWKTHTSTRKQGSGRPSKARA